MATATFPFRLFGKIRLVDRARFLYAGFVG